MGNILNVMSYCTYDTQRTGNPHVLARLFAWASKMNPSNDETKIMYYIFNEDTRTVSKHIECFDVLYRSLVSYVREGFPMYFGMGGMLPHVVNSITHHMPYNIVLNSASESCAKEIFLLMEQYPDYSFCFDVAKNLHSEMDICELRRAISICNNIDFSKNYLEELFNIAKFDGWFVLASVCDVIEALDDVSAGLDEYHKWKKHEMRESDMLEAAIIITRKKLYKKGDLV